MWAIVKAKRAKLFEKVNSRDELIEQILDIWNNLNPDMALDLALSFSRRIDECIAMNGWHTSY